MKAKDLRTKKPADLTKLLAEFESELRTIRFGASSGHTKNVKKARALRKDIARVKTLLHS